MSKHTPGPWTAERKKATIAIKANSPITGAPLAYKIGDVALHSENARPGYPQSEANARLIAAAPALLALVPRLVQAVEALAPGAGNIAIDATEIKNWNDSLCDAGALLAKIKGTP